MQARLLLLLLLGFPILSIPAHASSEPSELRDLHYGEALYQLYQQNYFHAIVRLLSAKQQGHMQTYQDEPDQLLGGLYLAYGMPDAAQTLFQRVLQRSANPPVHDRAWLQLAKTRHRRGQQDAAISAIGRIGQDLRDEEAEERQVLQGLIEMQQGRFPQALHSLSDLPGKSTWTRYGMYNQAIALLRMDRSEDGLKLLEEVASGRAEDEEAKSLRDRANLVRGLLLLEAKQTTQARQALEQIRISSLTANQALLGVGWAALQQNDPQAALAPWQELASRETQDSAVLEVILAIPYALSLLEDDQQSLQHYRLGIERFDRELQHLDQAISAVHQGQLLISLDDDPPASQQDQHPLISLLPLLMAENNFQERLQDYRDLIFLQANLQQWTEKIDSYQAMLAVRQAAYNERLPKVREKLSGSELHQLEAQREQLQRLIEQAESPSEPLFALANGKEKRLLERFEKIEGLLHELGKRTNLRNHREQADLLKGMLVWNTTIEHPIRLWETSKQLQTLDQVIEEARASQTALLETHQRTQGRFKGFAQQIQTLEDRIPALLTEVNRARLRQGELLQQMAVSALETRKALLNDYLIQARLGVASLLDRNSRSAGGAE
ncbi:MAG: tetratricopeptide repeat protein [Pseudomonadota bacterium]